MSPNNLSLGMPWYTPTTTPGVMNVKAGGGDATSEAYAKENANKEAYRFGGVIYNYAGDPIAQYYEPTVNTSNTTTQNVNPYAAAQKSFLASYPTALQNIYSSGKSATETGLGNIQTGAKSFFTTATRTAEDLKGKATQNVGQNIQAKSDILKMVGTGIRSGLTRLASKNAGSSSAAEELARIYGEIGSQKQSQEQARFKTTQEEIQKQTGRLTEDVNTYVNETLPATKTALINNIVDSARTTLTSLKSAAIDANLADKINIDAEIERVKTETINQLAGVDTYINNELSKYTTTNTYDMPGLKTEARRLINLGQGAPQMGYTTQPPLNYFGPQLPIYTKPKSQGA